MQYLLKYADEEYNWEKVLGYVVLKYTKIIKTSNIDITSSDLLSSTIMYTQQFTDISILSNSSEHSTIEQCINKSQHTLLFNVLLYKDFCTHCTHQVRKVEQQKNVSCTAWSTTSKSSLVSQKIEE